MDKRFIGIVLCFVIPVGISMSGCYYDKADLLYPQSGTIDCSTINAKFSTDVSSIMQNKCATSGCHDAAGNAAGVVLETYTQISSKAAAINDRCIVQKTMPPGSPLTDAEISILKCWISAGTPNN